MRHSVEVKLEVIVWTLYLMLVVCCVVQEQMLLTKDSLSQNMEAIKRQYEVHELSRLFTACDCSYGNVFGQVCLRMFVRSVCALAFETLHVETSLLLWS